jgi:hypothetical protein
MKVKVMTHLLNKRCVVQAVNVDPVALPRLDSGQTLIDRVEALLHNLLLVIGEDADVNRFGLLLTRKDKAAGRKPWFLRGPQQFG